MVNLISTKIHMSPIKIIQKLISQVEKFMPGSLYSDIILKKKLGVDFVFSYHQTFNYDQKNYIYSLELRNNF